MKEYESNLLVKLKTDELRIPLNEKDKLAVEVLDFLADKKDDLTVAEISENKDRLIPEEHLVLADVVETLSNIGDYKEGE